MSESTSPEEAESAELRQAVRRQLRDLEDALEYLAEDILGERSRFDLLARDAAGHPVVVLIGEVGADAELLTHGLAQAAWVEDRVGDWLQLAPDLELKAGAACRCWILCPDFRPETVAAARALMAADPGRPPRIQLGRLFRTSHAGRSDVALKPLPGLVCPAPAFPAPDALHPPDSTGFRSGLSDDDFGLSSAERRAILGHETG